MKTSARKSIFLRTCLLTLIAFITFFQKAQGAPIPLPDEFYVTQRWLSWTSTFDIETPSWKLGTVHRKFLSWTTQYDFYNNEEILEASAKARFWSWGACFDVVDNNEKPIGRIDQRLFHFFPTFDLVAPTGEILAVAQMNFWGTTYYMTDPVTSLEIAQVYRSFFRFKDDWTVKIVNRELFDQKGIDPRLFITLVTFQSDKEMWERVRQSWEQQRRNQERQDQQRHDSGLSLDELDELLDQ